MAWNLPDGCTPEDVDASFGPDYDDVDADEEQPEGEVLE